MKKVTVVILNYKVKDLTLKCIESVKKSSYPNTSIIIVDNDSGDGLHDEVKKILGIIFIQTGENLGYAGGNNIGIKRAIEEGAHYVFILNPDTTVDKDAIKILVKASENFQADILNPKIYFEGTKILWFAGKVFDRANVLGSHRGVDEKDTAKYNKPEEMEDITGAAVLVKKEVFEKVGFLDERFFLYYEESDFATRAKKAGFKIMYIPQAVVYHKNAQSTGLGTPLQDYFITRNRMLYAAKYLSLRTQFALFREAVKNIKNPARRLALFDFLTANFGKGSFLK